MILRLFYFFKVKSSFFWRFDYRKWWILVSPNSRLVDVVGIFSDFLQNFRGGGGRGRGGTEILFCRITRRVCQGGRRQTIFGCQGGGSARRASPHFAPLQGSIYLSLIEFDRLRTHSNYRLSQPVKNPFRKVFKAYGALRASLANSWFSVYIVTRYILCPFTRHF